MLKNYERWQKMTPEQRAQVRERWQRLTPEQRNEVRERWPSMSPTEREQYREHFRPGPAQGRRPSPRER